MADNDKGDKAETPEVEPSAPKKAAKAKSSGTKAKRSSKGKKSKATRKPRKSYPSVSLEKALQVAYRIRDKNGGNAWTPDQVATAVGMGSKTGDFFYITAASRDYGLTIGTRDSPEIALTELGRALVYADNPDDEHARKLQAFHNVELFKNVLSHYKGSDLPEMKYLANTLESKFKVPPEHHEDFSRVFRENAKFLNIKSGDALAIGEEDRQGPTTVVVGEPKQKTNLKAFVIMPFSEKTPDRPKGFFEEVLRSLITPSGLDAGFKVETANRQGSDVIQSTIVNELLEADLVIADLTDHNPNVLFELGLRMAGNKPVALIKAVGTGRVFDVDNMLRVYEYQPHLWRSTVETDLPELVKHFKAAWDNRATDVSYMKLLRRAKADKTES